MRGLVREQGHWGSFGAYFSHQMGGAPVHYLDLPGNGALWRQRSPTSVAAMVQACRAQLQAACIAPPYQLLALSLGAMVAVQWAHTHPTEVQRQVLVNTSMRPFNPFYERLQPRNWSTIGKLLLTSAPAVTWEEAILRMTTTGVHPHAVPAWVYLREQHPVATANALRQLWAAARFRAPPQAPPVPTLLLASTHDGLVSVACSRSIAAAWGTALVEHPHAGHDLPLDDPDWLIEQVTQWQRWLAK